MLLLGPAIHALQHSLVKRSVMIAGQPGLQKEAASEGDNGAQEPSQCLMFEPHFTSLWSMTNLDDFWHDDERSPRMIQSA